MIKLIKKVFSLFFNKTKNFEHIKPNIQVQIIEIDEENPCTCNVCKKEK